MRDCRWRGSVRSIGRLSRSNRLHDRRDVDRYRYFGQNGEPEGTRYGLPLDDRGRSGHPLYTHPSRCRRCDRRVAERGALDAQAERGSPRPHSASAHRERARRGTRPRSVGSDCIRRHRLTLTGWRIARRRYSQKPRNPFDGFGAARHGGRWNSPKTEVAYASSSLSLATLEYIAHIDREDAPTDIVRVSISFSDADVEIVVPRYPTEWDALAPSSAARTLGDEWVGQKRTLALAVPSVLVPTEQNYLINPRHPRMAAVTIGPLEDYSLDPRLIGSSIVRQTPGPLASGKRRGRS